MGLFSSLGSKKSTVTPSSMIEMYENLDRIASHLELRPTQRAILMSLQGAEAEKDVVVKLSTGSGKTIIGLTYAEYMRQKHPGELVAYICPNRQLITQVLREAKNIGVGAIQFNSDGDLALALSQGKVIVCTYDKLFTANSKFANQGVELAAIVIDDVHAGSDRVREKHTLRLTGDACAEVLQILHPLCKDSDCAAWDAIGRHASGARAEVPFWIWSEVYPAIREVIVKLPREGDLIFTWPNIERHLQFARCCASADCIELSLPIAPVEENISYSTAKHRLFMSASIKDGVSLLRDMNCSPAALTRIIHSESDKGGGERMILPTHLIDPEIKKSDIASLCKSFLERTNVVVLTSSNVTASFWQDCGATVRSGSSVDEAVDELKNTANGKFFVFSQRFDGVDLADHACRLLVIDGVPTGDRLCDAVDMDRLTIVGGVNAKSLNKFEQALGRSVRSNADYSAVLLVGTDIATFVGKRKVRSLLESHIDRQIDIGKEIAERLRDATSLSPIDGLREAISAVLLRDSEWRDRYKSIMDDVTPQAIDGPLTQEEMIAVAERSAWEKAKAQNYIAASEILQNSLDATRSKIDIAASADLITKMARYHAMHDLPGSHELYRKAFSQNARLPRPITLMDKRYTKATSQSANICTFAANFAELNGCLANLEQLKAALLYGNPAETVEDALQALGEFLGASSHRPEKETGRGPDVAWIFDDYIFCIEAKSEKTSLIFKSDASQLLLSKKWCEDKFSGETAKIIPVFATNTLETDRAEDVTFAPAVLTETALLKIASDLRGVLSSIKFDGPLFSDPAKVELALNQVRLRPVDILAHLRRIRT